MQSLQWSFQKGVKATLIKILNLHDQKNATIYAHPTDLNFRFKKIVKLKFIEGEHQNRIYSMQYLSDAMERKIFSIEA